MTDRKRHDAERKMQNNDSTIICRIELKILLLDCTENQKNWTKREELNNEQTAKAIQ